MSKCRLGGFETVPVIGERTSSFLNVAISLPNGSTATGKRDQRPAACEDG